MLTEYFFKVKSWVGDNKSDLYIASVIFLVGLASFGLGRLSVLWPEKEAVVMEQTRTDAESAQNQAESKIQRGAAFVGGSTVGEYVASKNGAAYHFPWCPGALRIKEENKIWFDTKEAAEKAGYRPAANCEGL